MVYKFASGSRLKVEAQAVGERLEVLSNENAGLVTPQLIVDDARPESSPMHGAFEWNDAAAAEQYRLDQARYLIRSIEVVQVEDGKSGPQAVTTVRAFLRTPSMSSSVYGTFDHIMSDTVLREEYVEHLRKVAAECRTRLSRFQEMAQACEAIDAALKGVAA